MKLAAALCTAAFVVCGLTACGSGDEAGDTAGNAVTSAHTAMDDAKSAAFVASFKAAFSPLAEGRSDEDIKAILDDTCGDLDDSSDEQAVQADIKDRAENNGTEPTDNQARQIYEMAKVACP